MPKLALFNSSKKYLIQSIELGDQHYPKHLLDLSDPPERLFFIGDIEVLVRPSIAIVGSREASVQGLRYAHRLPLGSVLPVITSFLVWPEGLIVLRTEAPSRRVRHIKLLPFVEMGLILYTPKKIVFWLHKLPRMAYSCLNIPRVSGPRAFIFPSEIESLPLSVLVR